MTVYRKKSALVLSVVMLLSIIMSVFSGNAYAVLDADAEALFSFAISESSRDMIVLDISVVDNSNLTSFALNILYDTTALSFNSAENGTGYSFSGLKLGVPGTCTVTAMSQTRFTEGGKIATLKFNTLDSSIASALLTVTATDVFAVDNDDTTAAYPSDITASFDAVPLTIDFATAIEMDRTAIEVYALQKYQLNVDFTPANAVNKSLTWESSAPEIATVDEEGFVKGISQGTAIITATAVDGGFTAQCEVTVQKALIALADSGEGVTPLTIDRANGCIISNNDNLTVEGLLNGLVADEGLCVYNGTTKLENTDLVGTNMSLRLYAGGSVRDVLTVLIRGDIDGNGRVETDDARKALRNTVDLETFRDIQILAADANNDGVITTDDARFILRVTVGLEQF